VIGALNPERFEVVLIGIDKAGKWHQYQPGRYLQHADDPERISLSASETSLALVPGEEKRTLVNLPDCSHDAPVDVVFPVLHGTYGEDGTIQGLLKMANIPFVGAGVLGSAVGMDKDVTKRLLREAGLPVGKAMAVRAVDEVSYSDAVERVGSPLFIKPANMGSSVGVHKVADESQFEPKLADAFRYDTKVLIEEFIQGREIECAVLGNEDPIASRPGEIIPTHEFYDYDAKYIDAEGARLMIPADLDEATAERIRSLAVECFKVLCCEGMARVDFFLRPNGEALINEINTIPGFTRISMYPKLWEASGVPYPELVDRLIRLAIERNSREQGLQTTV
jgi:D-alanine-D-alanine ligase